MEKKNNTIEQLKTRLNNKNSLNLDGVPKMDRVPSRTIRWFIDYSNDYFCSDYGMCFKHIIDTFRGMTPVGYDELQAQINEVMKEIDSMKEMFADKENKDKVKTMADGTVLR